MKHAFIIHGAYGNPTDNWIPWLKDQLRKLDYNVITPTFPIPEEQTLDNWLKVFKDYQEKMDSETIMIGHSLGAPFIFNVLQRVSTPIKASYLVAGFHTLLDHPIDEINKTFVESEFNWEKIIANCASFYMFNGSNDKYIDIAISDELAQKLNAKYEIIPDGGHLNSTAGYNTFNKLLDCIKDG